MIIVILVFSRKNEQIEVDYSVELQVQFDADIINADTVWLSQEQIVVLFKHDQSVISRHINNVFNEKELPKESNMQKMHIANRTNRYCFTFLT
jgi:hypothetical protein